MPNIVVTEISYNLLIIVDFLLNIIYKCFYLLIFVIRLLITLALRLNILESKKNGQRCTMDPPYKGKIIRGNIDANWQKLLSSELMIKTKSENGTVNKEQYTGTFINGGTTRKCRARKRPPNQTSASQIKDKVQENSNLEHNKNGTAFPPKPADKTKSLTKFIAMDCEMVGIGYDGEDHMLARVSLVNKFGDCIYDKFVKPREEVKDYRTKVSGVRKEDLLNGVDFATVQREVSELIKGKILVGHSLKNDLSVLFLSHPKRNIRDTSRYKPFRSITKGSTPSLKRLAKEILGIEIQTGEHSSVEDAQAVMKLYCTVSRNWEQMMSEKRGGRQTTMEH